MAAELDVAPHVSGLDESFDKVIRGLPEALLQAPDAPFLKDEELSRNPHAVLGALRERHGGVIMRGADGMFLGQAITNFWGHDPAKPQALILSHSSASAIAIDNARFVNEGAYGMHVKALGKTINCLDGLEHSTMRRLFDVTIFGRKAIKAWVSAITVPTVEYLVDRVRKMIANGETPDARRDLALPAAYKSISTIIGVPQEGFARFVELGEKTFGGPRDMQAAMNAVEELDFYLQDQLERRREEPRSDMLTIMGSAEHGGRRLSDQEIVQHCRFLLPGGIETTWRQSANLIMCMLLHPDQYQNVVADLSLVDPTVEEALRWAPSGFVVPRIAAEDIELEGVEIPAGSSIASILGVANRDPKVFDRPDEFDQMRTPNLHLTFHTGVHYCMGQHLARYVMRSLLTAIARELPRLTLAGDPGEVGMQGLALRNPTALPLSA